MRSPEIVLNTLSVHSNVQSYKYERLYRILFNKEMYYVAYEAIHSNIGNLTAGADGKTMDGISIPLIDKLIDSLRDESYSPMPARRVYIPKKNGKLRPLGIPSFYDKLVQQVVKMILEAIYEGHFENVSHGFRPNRSCHTALIAIQRTFTGAKWFIEGDIKGFFDNIDHDVLIEILKERIADDRFLRLIRKFLKAGYIEDWKFNNTYSGTPQGGIISPILANIYLDKFDKYMIEYAKNFDKGECRQRNDEYYCLNTRAVNLRKKYRAEKNKTVKAQLLKDLKAVQNEKLSTDPQDPMDENYRRLKYIRYADDFLIGVIGSKTDCEKIKANIAEFMSRKLKLELSEEKTLMTHSSDNAKFLGYNITVRSLDVRKRTKKGNLQRNFRGKVRLNLSSETVKAKLIAYDAVKFVHENGKNVWKPKARTKMIGMKPEDMLATYNSQIQGFYNYYCIANNVSSTCADFGYIMEYSLYKTLGQKLRMTTKQLLDKYCKDKDFVITYKDSKGNERCRILYNGGFKRLKGYKEEYMDEIQRSVFIPKPRLAERLKAGVCELCGTKTDVVMHHVRRLNSLDGNTPWGRKMLQQGRKSLVVCESCMKKIKLAQNKTKAKK